MKRYKEIANKELPILVKLFIYAKAKQEKLIHDHLNRNLYCNDALK